MSEPYTESFEAFWKTYPRKTAKPVAFKSWLKNIEGDAFLPTQIIHDLEKRTRLNWWAKDKTKIPHASTWLNQRRWEDEDWEDESDKKKPTSRFSKNDDGVRAPESIFVDEYAAFRDKMTVWQKVANQFLLLYLRVAQGLTDDELAKIVKTKNATVKECATPFNEDLSSKTSTYGELKVQLWELLGSRFDHDLNKSLRYRCLR